MSDPSLGSASPRAVARGEVWLYPYFLSPVPQAVPQAVGFLSPLPQAVPQAAGFLSPLPQAVPQAAGFLSPLPQAVPQAVGFSSRSLPRLNRFFNDMIKTSLRGVCRS